MMEFIVGLRQRMQVEPLPNLTYADLVGFDPSRREPADRDRGYSVARSSRRTARVQRSRQQFDFPVVVVQ